MAYPHGCAQTPCLPWLVKLLPPFQYTVTRQVVAPLTAANARRRPPTPGPEDRQAAFERRNKPANHCTWLRFPDPERSLRRPCAMHHWSALTLILLQGDSLIWLMRAASFLLLRHGIPPRTKKCSLLYMPSRPACYLERGRSRLHCGHGPRPFDVLPHGDKLVASLGSSGVSTSSRFSFDSGIPPRTDQCSETLSGRRSGGTSVHMVRSRVSEERPFTFGFGHSSYHDCAIGVLTTYPYGVLFRPRVHGNAASRALPPCIRFGSVLERLSHRGSELR